MAGDGACDWYEMPAAAGHPEGRGRTARRSAASMRELAKTPEAKRINAYYRELAGEIDYGPTSSRTGPGGPAVALVAAAAAGGLRRRTTARSTAAAAAVGQELGGSVARSRSAATGSAATEAEKLATIEDIRSQVNREDAGVEASELTDDEAMEVFENGCDEPAPSASGST